MSENFDEYEKDPNDPNQKIFDWRIEVERRDTKSLRDFLNKDSSTESLKILLDEQFTVRPDEVALIKAIAHNYKQRMKDEKRFNNANYDYSVESRIFLSFVRARMQEKEISQQSLNQLKTLSDFFDEKYIKSPNDPGGEYEATRKTYRDTEKDLFLEMEKIAEQNNESQKIIEILLWAQEYFYFLEKVSDSKEEMNSYPMAYNPVLGYVPDCDASLAKSNNDAHAYRSAPSFFINSLLRSWKPKQ